MLQYYNIEQKQQLHWRNCLNFKNSLQMGKKKKKLTKSLYILKLEAYEKKKERKKPTENFP